MAVPPPLARSWSAAIPVSSTSETVSRRRRRQQWIALAGAGLVYALAVVALARMPGNGFVEPIFMFGMLVVAFPACAWMLTRRQAAERIPAPPVSATKMWALLGYLAVFAAAILGYGFGAINEAFPDQPLQSIVKLAAKLVSMVAIPWWLFARNEPISRAAGGSTSRNAIVLIVLGTAFTVFQCVVGRGLQNLAALHASSVTLAWAIPACLIWQIVEAGLGEEVLFRRVLQERLAGATHSQIVAIAWSSLLFGLAHAPGLYLRGSSLLEGVAAPTPAWAIAYSIAMIAPAGVLFGVIWARTRSLWLVVLLHGIVDLVPQLAGFVQDWQHVV
jgi:membrane protease YdiL (CAAX protease family)